MSFFTNNKVAILFVLLAVCVIGVYMYANNMYMFDNRNSPSPSMTMMPMASMASMTTMPSQTMKSSVEGFSNNQPTITQQQMQQQMIDASESIEDIEQPQGLNIQQENVNTNLSQMPSECYPKDVLSSADLLPRDANSQWAQVNPSGQGSLADQNFLTSGFHIGINTVGQSLRNANRQIRSEPLNPQVKVSPWQQTTIEPDVNRRPLEIQGDL